MTSNVIDSSELLRFKHNYELLKLQNIALKNCLEISLKINDLLKSNDSDHQNEISKLENELSDWKIQLAFYKQLESVSIPEIVVPFKEEQHAYAQYLNELPYNFKCDICDKRFQFKNDCDNHNVRHGNDDNNIRCAEDNCLFRTNNIKKLKLHTKTIHTGKSDLNQTSFKCKTCQDVFDTSSKLRVHEAQHKRVFRNSNCQKTSQKKDKVEKKYQCEFEGCNSSFVNKKSFIVHQEKKHFLKNLTNLSSETNTNDNHSLSSSLDVLYNYNRTLVTETLH